MRKIGWGLDPRTLLRDPYPHPCGYCGRQSWFALRAAIWSGAWVLSHTDERPLISALYQCGGPHCERSSLFVFQTFDVIGQVQADLLDREVVPAARARHNSDLPREIDSDRVEAWNCSLAGQHRAAIIMARTALQRAVRTLSEFRGTLNVELDNLVKEGIITQQLRDNADEVRLNGNDVAHPEDLGEVTEHDVRDSLTFLDDFLDTTLAVPERQRARREAREQRNNKG